MSLQNLYRVFLMTQSLSFFLFPYFVPRVEVKDMVAKGKATKRCSLESPGRQFPLGPPSVSHRLQQRILGIPHGFLEKPLQLCPGGDLTIGRADSNLPLPGIFCGTTPAAGRSVCSLRKWVWGRAVLWRHHVSLGDSGSEGGGGGTPGSGAVPSAPQASSAGCGYGPRCTARSRC